MDFIKRILEKKAAKRDFKYIRKLVYLKMRIERDFAIKEIIKKNGMINSDWSNVDDLEISLIFEESIPGEVTHKASEEVLKNVPFLIRKESDVDDIEIIRFLIFSEGKKYKKMLKRIIRCFPSLSVEYLISDVLKITN